MKRSEGWRWAVVGIAAGLCAACSGGITSMGHLSVVRPRSVAPEAHLEALVRTARALGYGVSPLQPSRARFGLYARYTDPFTEEHGPYRIAVECHPTGRCTITPIGPRVEEVHGEWHLPEELRVELLRLRAAFQRAGFPRET